MERHRLVWLFLQRETDLFQKNLTVMHAAPELLFQKRFQTLPNLKYTSIDLDLKTSLAMEEMDLTQIRRPDESIDVFLCSHVLEHIPDDRKAMKEIYRVLKKGGWALLQVPLDESRTATFEDFSITTPTDRERVFGQTDHVRIYGRDYVDRLKSAGFEVNVIDYVKRFPPGFIQTHRLALDEKIYLCKKAI